MEYLMINSYNATFSVLSRCILFQVGCNETPSYTQLVIFGRVIDYFVKHMTDMLAYFRKDTLTRRDTNIALYVHSTTSIC